MSTSKDKVWDEYSIKAAIYRKGETLTSLAKASDLASASIRGAFIRPHARANRAIAKFLAVPVQKLWPDWFDSDGELIPRHKRQASRESARRASHESPAA